MYVISQAATRRTCSSRRCSSPCQRCACAPPRRGRTPTPHCQEYPDSAGPTVGVLSLGAPRVLGYQMVFPSRIPGTLALLARPHPCPWDKLKTSNNGKLCHALCAEAIARLSQGRSPACTSTARSLVRSYVLRLGPRELSVSVPPGAAGRPFRAPAGAICPIDRARPRVRVRPAPRVRTASRGVPIERNPSVRAACA